MIEPRLELDEHPSPEDFRTILDGVRAFNRAQTGNETPRPVAYYLRDEAGQSVVSRFDALLLLFSMSK